MSSLRSARSTRLDGSGVVPRVFALAALAIITIFLAVWVSMQPDALGNPLVYVIEGGVLALAIRSLFVGVYLADGAVLVRGWFRDYRYEKGGLRTVAAVPYWKFLDRNDPILALLKFTPEAGWVREIAATVAWKDRAAAHAAAIERHLS